jgi:transposase
MKPMMGQTEPGPIPAETARAARAAFPKGNVHMRMRDEFGQLFEDAAFKVMYSRMGHPGEAPWRLLLVTMMQYAEGLSDRQAADAVRDRLSWKYVLGLGLEDAGFDASVLCEFRDRLLEYAAERHVFEVMLNQFQARGLVKAGGRQRTDSTHVLSAMRTLNRLELVGETLRAALNGLAGVVPSWVQALAPVDWYERYSKRFEETRLPKGLAARQAYAAQIGRDGLTLLNAIEADADRAWLGQLPCVQVLRSVWQQQYIVSEGQLRMRTAEELAPAGERINTPYDPEAGFGTKGGLSWSGYKVHFTESCDPGSVHLITHVETTKAEILDHQRTDPIQQALIDQGVPPAQHLVDAGYIDADLLVTSPQQQGIELVGPVRQDSTWQAQAAQGFALADFTVDWDLQAATCPQGKRSRTWVPAFDANRNAVIHVEFSIKDCKRCPVRALCTQSTAKPRGLTLRPQPLHAALQAARQFQTTPEFKTLYAKRAGIEDTLSEATRSHALRRSRYVGLARTHLQHLFTALAINWIRVGQWLAGRQQATTRVAAFAALAPS